MIKFVTEAASPSEQDLVIGHEYDDLILVPLDSSVQADTFTRIPAPEGGWSHDRLKPHADTLYSGDAYFLSSDTATDKVFQEGSWIGSSEV